MGSYVVEALRREGCKYIFVPRSREYDLVDLAAVERLYSEARPHIVIHLAGRSGGIASILAEPTAFLRENLLIGLHLLQVGCRVGIEKYVAIGSTSSYPANVQIPIKEEYLWDGYPAEPTASYGLAKRILFTLGEAYRREFDLKTLFLIPSNIYGPRDHFGTARAGVVADLIQKFVDAVQQKASVVEVWGTGRATRDFLYVEDVAEGILLAAERYGESDPINLGTGRETSLRQLAEKIAWLTGFCGTIFWNPAKPEGNAGCLLDVTKAWERFGFRARIDLDEGLSRTIAWYVDQMRDQSVTANDSL